MKILRQTTIAELQAHEERLAANARLGGYEMDAVCPINEFEIYIGESDEFDLNTIHLLGEYASRTHGNTGLVRDIILEQLSEKSRATLAYYASLGLDVRSNEAMSPIVVTPNLATGPFIAIDGNHKFIHQVTQFGSVACILSFVCVHPKICAWAFVPHHARSQN